jgi:hypothetical protein
LSIIVSLLPVQSVCSSAARTVRGIAWFPSPSTRPGDGARRVPAG